MKTSFYFLFFIALFFLSCSDESTENNTPKCTAETCTESYKECKNDACVLKSGSCEKNGDCIGKELCNPNTNQCEIFAQTCEDKHCETWEACHPETLECQLKENRCNTNGDCAGLNVYCNQDHQCIEADDPCQTISCSGHGDCVLQNNQPICDCHDGYHAFMGECIENTELCEDVNCEAWEVCNQATGSCELKNHYCNRNSDCPTDSYCEANTHTCILKQNPCEDVNCSGKGNCAIKQGEAICICEEGYQVDGLNCVNHDPCETVSCQAWETCNMQTGACDLNTERCNQDGDCMGEKICDQNHNCVAPEDPCEGVTCSSHGNCVLVSNMAVCACDDGFHANNLTCIPNNLCDGVTCDSWKYCDMNTGACVLQDGRCEANNDCSNNQYCTENHQCKNIPSPCDGITCSSHGTCAIDESNLPLCACDAGYHPEGLSCVEDEADLCANISCDEWMACNALNGLCETKDGRCTDNSDCESNEFCNDAHVCAEVVNPCDGVTCSDHGTCAIEYGYPICTCDDGYEVTEDGFSCIWTGYVWANTIGTTANNENIHGVTADSLGNIYIVGSFVNTLDFDPSTSIDEKTSNYYNYSHRYEAFVSKYDINGRYKWTKTFGENYDDTGYTIATDQDNNVYVSYYASTYNRMIIYKLSQTGVQVWEKTIYGTAHPRAMAFDQNKEYFYLAGHFTGSFDFDPNGGTAEHTSAGGSDYFLLKFDRSGNLMNSNTSGGTDDEQITSITLDTFNNVYLSGYFEGTTDLRPDAASDPHSSKGNTDAFVVKFNNDNTYAWGKAFGGNGYDRAHGLQVDALGSIYIAGQFSGNADFDPSSEEHLVTASGSNDAFLLKLNNRGLFDFVKPFQSSHSESAKRVLLNNDKLYLLGSFTSSITFEDGNINSTHQSTSSNLPDLFILTLDTAGAYMQSKTFGGSGTEYLYDAIFDHNALYLVGTFEKTVDFNPEADWNNAFTSNGQFDLFTFKYLP